jgi:hypothetical protein
METLKADLKAANIPFVDAKGRRADFHSLRHTLATNLALAGVAPRVAMEAMRHSDIRLTTKTYTDADMLPVTDAVAKLPSFMETKAADSQIDSQSLSRPGPDLSSSDTNLITENKSQISVDQELRSSSSTPVTTSPDNQEWCAVQGSNL